MLVLSRKKNESIVINNDIVVTVLKIHGDKVRLRFDAANTVRIWRREVYNAKRQCEESDDSCDENGSFGQTQDPS